MVNQQFAFAVHIMTALAFAGKKLDSAALAASVNTNPVVVRRLLQSLARAGLVETSAGRQGGSQLKKRPGQISLLQIYEAVQARPLISPHARKTWKRCPVSCNMQRIMSSVAASAEAAVRARLRRIKLSELVRQIEA